jgi:LysM repeat protein
MPQQRRRRPSGAGRYLAPAAFLLAVTIAALLIRSGLRSDHGSATTTLRGPVTHAPTTVTRRTTGKTTTRAGEVYTVQSGDTFGSISAKTGVSIAQLEQLNPGVSSNSLQVGQRLRVK